MKKKKECPDLEAHAARAADLTLAHAWLLEWEGEQAAVDAAPKRAHCIWGIGPAHTRHIDENNSRTGPLAGAASCELRNNEVFCVWLL